MKQIAVLIDKWGDVACELEHTYGEFYAIPKDVRESFCEYLMYGDMYRVELIDVEEA